MKRKVSLFIFMVFMLSPLIPLMATQGAVNAVGLELSSSSATVGFELSIKGTGLTDGNNYRVDAAHSDGNISDVATAVGSTAYFKITFTAEDSDGIVPVHLGDATSAGALTGGTDATVLLTLKTAGDLLPDDFFLGVIAPLLTLGIVFGLAGIFVFRRMRK